MTHDRLRTTLLAVAVVLLLVIAMATTYPYYRSWRAERAVAIAVEQARAKTEAATRMLRSVTADLSSVGQCKLVWTNPAQYESNLIIRVKNGNDSVVEYAFGRLRGSNPAGAEVISMPLPVQQAIPAQGSTDIAVVATVPECPTTEWKITFGAEALTLASGDVVKLP